MVDRCLAVTDYGATGKPQWSCLREHIVGNSLVLPQSHELDFVDSSMGDLPLSVEWMVGLVGRGGGRSGNRGKSGSWDWYVIFQ